MRRFSEPLESRTMLSGNGFAAAYFASADFTNLKLARTDSIVSFDWSAGAPSSTLGSNYSVRWSGRVQARYTEQYRFITMTAGSVRLWVNGNLIIDDSAAHDLHVASGYINLVAGKRYDIRMEYANAGVNAPYSRLYFQSAHQAKVLVPRGDLYSAVPEAIAPAAPTNVKTSYVTDTTIKVIWSPATDASGTVLYDVYLGKTKVATTNSTSYTRSGRVANTAYSFSVRSVDIFGNPSRTSAIVVTTKPTVAPAGGTGLSGKYYAGDSFNEYELTRTDSPIDFNWSTAPIQTTDGSFSTVWSGTIVPKYSETYTFYVSNDDGVRLYVGNQLLVDRWTNPTGGEDSGVITLQAGKGYAISLQYRNTGGDGHVALKWSSLSQVKQDVPGTQLFAQFVDASAPSAPGNLRVTSVSNSTVNLSWNASTDDVAVASYDIYRDSQKIANVAGTSFSDSGLSGSTSYQYTVRAIDGAAHQSAASNAVNATTNSSGVTHDALSVIPATGFDAQSGVSTSGSSVTNFDNGDWIRFDSVDFHGGVNSVKIILALATTTTYGSFELHLDSTNGTKIGTLVVQPTGSSSTYYTQQTEIGNVSGVHALYIVGKTASAIASVQSIQFSNTSLVKVMPLGDSITQEFNGTPSWRYYLYQTLLADGKDVDFVGSQTQATNGYNTKFNFDQNHEGHSGWTTAQLLSALPGFLSLNVPDVVTLLIGTNDLRTGVSQQTAINNVSSIINTLRGANPNVKILLSSILPIFDVSNTITEAYNSAIQSLASSKNTGQSPVVFVDQYTGFNANTDSDDGLHPNNVGEQKMAGVWDNAMEGLL